MCSTVSLAWGLGFGILLVHLLLVCGGCDFLFY